MSDLSEFYGIEILKGWVVITRTGRGFAGMAEIRSISEQVIAKLADHRRSPLLVDLRKAPGRSDPAFESYFAEYRTRMLADHPRAAIVVQSAVGSLQVRRHMREDNQDRRVRVFQSLEDAHTYLAQV